MTVSLNNDICCTGNDGTARRYRVIDNNAFTSPQSWSFQ
ncbi:hypothetical protein MTCD1_00563 [Colwellia marinimaniae]|uniref:Uncharacterized protein n=1 Tax=Colwellia marinimaniae TaxID=1513592 RepID=A0ABQ0MRH8_9GAMM|nr:hypothetical protein MTCD1_00563 [Colwellia marinimaniae]